MNSKVLKRLLYCIWLAAISTACVMEDVSKPPGEGEDESSYTFQGCIDGQGVGTNSIQINFQFPSVASRIRIKRNGNQVAEFSQANATTTHIDDSGLREGATYLYTCEAFVDGLWAEGTRALQLSTLAVNAPVFPGIVDAVAQSSDSVLVSWTPSVADLPVSAYSYKVYANLGTTVDWSIPAKATVLHGATGEALIEDLGDELSYSFGVRACSEGDVCETNTVQRTVLTPDGGPPTTIGANALAVENGRLKITAPWNEQNGGIHRRYVYVRTGPTGGTNIGDYVLQRTYQLSGSELFSPPEELEILSLQEGMTYHVIVQDEDPSGQRSVVTQYMSLTTDDITPPGFAGITTLASTTPEDSALRATWTAIATEASDPIAGGVIYRILTLSSPSPISTNPCLFGDVFAEIPVANYTAGDVVNYDLTGLDEKTYYSVCVKAVDNLGNVSANNNYQQSNTKDITAPEFFGVQNLAYNNQTAELQATWSPSASSDIKEYRISVWANDPVMPPGALVLVRSHVDAASGTSISATEFTINDGDQVFVSVEACDLTESPFGTQNCTTTGTQRTISLPDVTPPLNFLGIRGATDIETPAEGSFLVKWNAPADWTDYQGFKVYTVETATQDLNLLETCLCGNGSCADPSDRITECTVNGLDPFRTYRLHVRAFDYANNETIYLDPAVSFADKRTTDNTAPTFASNLTIGPAPEFTLIWNGGTDNQYSAEPGAQITYEVYQKNSPFDFTSGLPDGNLKVTTDQLSFQDSGFEESETYYYTVCAKDASGNRNCDERVREAVIPDVTDPIIRNLSSDKTIKAKVWELSWEMQDNISDSNDIHVEIRQKVSENGDLATSTDFLVYNGYGADVLVSGNEASTASVASLDPLSGPADLRRKINYLVTVRDEAGNTSSQNITIDIDNTLQITDVKSTSGPEAGGQLLAIYGRGFTKAIENRVGQDTLVTIGGKECTNVKVISEGALSCFSPEATTAGSVEVRVRNQVNASTSSPLYSNASLTNGYTYNSTPRLCDDPGAWDTEFADGDGESAADAFVICNVGHLNNVRTKNDAYFRLGANIDLDGETFAPFTAFAGHFDGDGHIISNWTYNNASENSVGFFGSVNGSFQITNLGLVDIDVQGAQTVGGLIGLVNGGVNRTALLSKVFVTGNISGEAFVGGLIGRKQQPHINFNMINSYFIGEVEGTQTTGYVGGIMGFTGPDSGGFFQNIYSEGLIQGVSYVGGLFGSLGQNKQLVNSFSRAEVVASGNFAGGLAGESRTGSSINNSYVESSTVTGNDSIGGLVGMAEGTVQNSRSHISVTSLNRRGGGAIGYASGATVNNVYTDKDQNVKDSGGGLIGEALNATITDSYALGNVISSGNDVGGLIGKVTVGNAETSLLSKLYAKGFVDTTSSGVGGLVGNVDLQANAEINVEEVFAESQVGSDFSLPNQQYGGLIGKVNTLNGAVMNLSDCYAQGDVYGGGNTGGLIGGFDTLSGQVYINRCYSSVRVVGGDIGRGGLLGASTLNHNISDTYWDTQLSTKAFATGSGAYSGSATGYSTDEMLDYVNSIYLGWDFVDVWMIPASGYPRLVFEQ